MKPRRCTQCGKSLAGNTKSCPNCGAVIRQRGVTSDRNRGKRGQRFSFHNLSLAMLLFAGVALLVLAIAIVALNPGQSEPAALSGRQPTNSVSDVHNDEGIPYPEVPRLSIAEAKALYDTNTAIFVDVRSSQEYQAAHIPGALSLPLADLQSDYQELPTEGLILLYCT